MASTSMDYLVDALRQYRLLDPAQLEELPSLQSRFPNPETLTAELVQRGWLSAYQANQLLLGDRPELLLGSYVLLERLGEGGMGQVFKAKNWKLGRVVALKVIRKDRLDSPDNIRRFEREVRAAAALSHPNIVMAHDADLIDGTHLLVMEFIPGAADLAGLVKTNGPLPVAQACDYIRQAAWGLQHAFERGLVHRDIKPANLLVTADRRTVKILDMGLARLDQPADDAKSTTMTQQGLFLGTPDYIAPEQALESHTVDIRADLYSLGCAFYYLLTGKPPFPTGSLIQKINKHQFEEPPPIERLRPEVTPEVAAVVRKLMAKKPEERYQTPAELAAVLGDFGSETGASRTAEMVKEPPGNIFDSPVARLAGEKAPPAGRRPLLLAGMAGGAFVLAGLGVLLFLYFQGLAEKNPPAPGSTLPSLYGPVNDAWLRHVAALPANKQPDAVASKLMELNPGFDGKVKPKFEVGVVTGLEFLTDRVTDLSPVRALPELRLLRCAGSVIGKGKLADLSPLKDMKLVILICGQTQVSSLWPLQGMKLTHLYCGNTPVKDLAPLKGMSLIHLDCQYTPVDSLAPLEDVKLTYLRCGATNVKDLAPLKDMKLTTLYCFTTPVSDLSALKNMKLINFDCRRTQVADLSLLRGMPIKELRCDFRLERDAEILRSLPMLETINDMPAAYVLKQAEAKKEQKKP